MKGPKVCNGQETVDGYDQEGLVPFVGKWIIWIKYLPLVFFLFMNLNLVMSKIVFGTNKNTN